ncbi:ABC transporter permease [Spirilliplanes yamanashiensis]|uniref:Transport permease protein n=1 Tax=Spirilliplanes yamanashiensis TaxID=42233 RepID=A0A8J3YD23_9ACTN|nr:ABC transporter permease [Spirilliplanes yamanashiensis]MDP9816210.1 ABC-2 type transport system permease protein [Spirilliplanes yamanashiensis]GIJ05735.1 transport permease protein [Spirilliplanes yamanashiensis]
MPAAILDASVLIGRSLRHTRRALDTLLIGVLLPVMILLLFVYVFGGAIDPGGRYLTYVVPGIVLLCAGYGAAGTAVPVAADMTTGAIDRFRSLPILRSAVLVGHVTASIVRNLVSTALVLLVAFAIGYRPGADPGQWLAALGVLVLYLLAMSWLAVCFGLLASSAEGASSFSFVILFLPYLSSAFVPVDTMPAVLRGFAAHQPLTPVIEAIRGLLAGAPDGGTVALAAAWSAGLLALGYGAATYLFGRRARR